MSIQHHHQAPGRRVTGFRRKWLAAAIAASLAGGAAFGLAVAPQAALDSATPNAVLGFPVSFADIVENVERAVVNISVETRTARASLPAGIPDEYESMLRRFFGGRMPPPMPEQQQAVASGFIVDAAGYIVTNHHVIENADNITVTLNDGAEYPATLVGSDAKTDIAVLKVDAPRELPYISFGDSDKIRPGDWVMAIGNPFGLGGTVTAGIVSARGRNINAGPYDDFIQIDAPINRGNSGGPIFDASGKVVGVNTAIFSPTGGSVGIGFAVPASLAAPLVAELREHGSIARGWLGVMIQPVSAEIAESLGLEQAAGALVSDVMPDSPAQKAGLQAGDVVLALNGAPISDSRELVKQIGALDPSDSVKLRVWRDDKVIDKSARLTAVPGAEKVAGAPAPKATGGRLGLSLAPLGAELRDRYQIGAGVQGVAVVGVDPDGRAAAQGIRIGDVITMINRDKVTAPATVVTGIDKALAANRRSVLLRIERNGYETFLAVPIA